MHKYNKLIACIFLFFILILPSAASDNSPRPIYPIMLVHGIIERTDIFYPNSSKPIAAYLNNKGIKTFIANLDSLGSIESNGKMLSEIIKNTCRENDIEKLNIIAFSKGGLDSRLAAHEPGTGSFIASITTISTPHRGTPAADFFSSNPITSSNYMEDFMNTAAGMAGDQQQNFIKAVKQLGIEEMKEFNRVYPDLADIAYFSFSAFMQPDDYHFVFSLLRAYIYFYQGANDGLIPISSARWGEYLGTANSFMNYSGSLNHPDLVGLDIYPNSGFDYLEFYRRITVLLAEKGF